LLEQLFDLAMIFFEKGDCVLRLRGGHGDSS
jgi:hypothetical protein